MDHTSNWATTMIWYDEPTADGISGEGFAYLLTPDPANQGGIQTWGNNGVDGIKTEPPFEFEVDYEVTSYNGLITGVSKPWPSPNGGHWVDEHGIGVTATVFGLDWKRRSAVDVPVSPG